MRTLETVLHDGASGHDGKMNVKVEAAKYAAEVYIEGFGSFGTDPGNGAPILLELYEGKLRLLVWADINNEEPTHVIDLSGAREECRK